MKLIVTANKLNVRKTPVIDFAKKSNIVEVILKDSIHESTEQHENSLGVWHKIDGGWVNEKWLSETKFQDWILDLKLPEIWKLTKGRNVGVCVIDTGISSKISSLVYDKKKFYLSKNCSSIEDTDGHGTFCAGLIGAKNIETDIIGVAPDSNLFIAKISNSKNLPENPQNDDSEKLVFADAINWCNSQKDIKIISLSWGCFISPDRKPLIQAIQDAINNAAKNGKIIIAARGNTLFDDDDSLFYPACLDNVISVGISPGMDNQNHNYLGHKTILVPGDHIKSFSPLENTSLKMDSGTSMSTAIMAGIICLILDRKGQNQNIEDIKQIIPLISDPITLNNENNRIINGTLLMSFLKNT
jgi:subtilisin family serine protease